MAKRILQINAPILFGQSQVWIPASARIEEAVPAFAGNVTLICTCDLHDYGASLRDLFMMQVHTHDPMPDGLRYLGYSPGDSTAIFEVTR